MWHCIFYVSCSHKLQIIHRCIHTRNNNISGNFSISHSTQQRTIDDEQHTTMSNCQFTALFMLSILRVHVQWSVKLVENVNIYNFFLSNTQLHADSRWWVTCAGEEEKYINRLNCSATWLSSPLFDQQRPRYGNANRWANRGKKITWRLSNMWTKKSRRFDRLSCRL